MEQKLRRDRALGDNLRRLRNASGLSQEKLCAELQRRGCDIGRTTYAKYEAGERNVRVSVLLALKKLYGCPFDALAMRTPYFMTSSPALMFWRAILWPFGIF